jgi:hypothetical protein
MKLKEFSDVVSKLAREFPEYDVFTQEADRQDDGGPLPGEIRLMTRSESIWICMDAEREE